MCKIPRIRWKSIRHGIPVCVVWIDIRTETNWTDRKEFLIAKGMTCSTHGVWAGITSAWAHIVHNESEDGDCDGTHIPVGVIQEIWS
jgi:hypothetical protein